MIRRPAAHLLSLVFALLVATPALAQKDAPQNDAVVPAPKTTDTWVKRQNVINERAKQGDVDLLFVGDSITQGWEGKGKAVWEKYYGNRKAMNAGLSGDRTQHVLWRLDHGNVDGIHPKLAVVMIGTNNSNKDDNTAEQIGEGIKAIVGKLREKLPDTKILLLAVFPRGEKPNPQREKNAKASEIASKMADDKMIFYMDIGPKLLEPDGTLTMEMMPDANGSRLHPGEKGYEVWAEAIEPKVAELLGEKKQ
jgi:lysophospholipase L1-like esterase